MAEHKGDTGVVTAAVLVIGDEILSGRTKDRNIAYIAEYLTAVGIDLREVRVVGDEEGPIVEALNALRHRYTYVFTTGGIGPTHDDITADCVAKAFGVAIGHDPRAVAILSERLAKTGGEMNEARMRMTRIPAGADLSHLLDVLDRGAFEVVVRCDIGKHRPRIGPSRVCGKGCDAERRKGSQGSETTRATAARWDSCR